jgi:hypothetical protein
MLVIAGAILVVLTLGTITLARAIGRATTVTLSPTTALSIPAGAAQGLSTFLVDGAYTYVANEGQHQIDVYVGGQWKRALQLPAEVMNVQQMAVLGSQLVVHYRTDQQRLVTLNLATGFPTFVDLAGAVPAAKLSPLSMRVDGSAVRISVLRQTAAHRVPWPSSMFRAACGPARRRPPSPWRESGPPLPMPKGF